MQTLKLLLTLLIAPLCFAQPTQSTIIPPCTLNFTFDATHLTSANLPNQQIGCDKFTLTVYNAGFGSFTVTLQSALAATTSTPGTFGTYTGTTATGSNPLTTTGVATFTNGTVATPWLRVVFTGTGSGTVYGVLQGSQTVISKGGGGGGGGGPTITGTANEITASGAGCTTGSTATCNISIPSNPVLPGVTTSSGFTANGAFSGSVQMNGFTSGGVTVAVADVAGTAIVYVLPSTNGTAGQVLSDSGATTCPTLPAGYPTTCHLLQWIASGGSGFGVQVNGTPLTGLTTLNFVAGSNISLVPTGSGTYTLTVSSTGTATGGASNGYSAPAVTLPTAGNTFIPPVGGGLPSTTEANVQWTAPVTATVSDLGVNLSTAIGTGNSISFTFRDGGSSQAVTCTISGASAKTCTDLTHSFSVTQGDLLDILITTTGTVVAAPNVQIGYEYGGGGPGGGNKVTFGTYPTFPGTPSAGDLFFANNSPHLFGYSGSAWLPYNGDSQGVLLTSFTNSGYTWTHQDGSTVTAVDVDYIIANTANSCTTTGDCADAYMSGTALSIPYTYRVHIWCGLNGVVSSACSAIIGDGTKFITFDVFNGGNGFNVAQFNNATSFNTNTYASPTSFQAQKSIWLQIKNNSTTRSYSYSVNGVDYVPVFSEAAGTFLTESKSGVGFHVTFGGGASQSQFRLDSLAISNP